MIIRYESKLIPICSKIYAYDLDKVCTHFTCTIYYIFIESLDNII